MLKMVLIVALLGCIGCEDEEVLCTSSIDCTDDKEMVCDLPVTHEYANGEVVEIRACTYITYENCFERTVCKPKDNK
jgi:hypothetical protein